MIYRYASCKPCGGSGQRSVFDPRPGDVEPYREIACPRCGGSGRVAVGVLSAEELSIRIQELQRHASHMEHIGRCGDTLPKMPAAGDTVRDHAAQAE